MLNRLAAASTDQRLDERPESTPALASEAGTEHEAEHAARAIAPTANARPAWASARYTQNVR